MFVSRLRVLSAVISALCPMCIFAPSVARAATILIDDTGSVSDQTPVDSASQASGQPATGDIASQAEDLQKSGKTTEALQSLVDAQKAGSTDTRIESEIERIVSSGLPSTMPRALFAGLSVDVSPVDRLGTAVVVRDFVPSTASEPQSGTPFPRVCYIYRPSHTNPDVDVQVFCRVHYTETADAGLALRAGRLLLLGRNALMTETHHAPYNDDDQPVDVWLCRGGVGAGEQWRNNLYFYDLDTPRSSIEWIREILHEYSHLAIPAVGGYTAPEYWANGYLGERLLVRWLERMPDGPELVTKLWGDFSGSGNFNRLLIDPAIALYAKIGPNKQWQSRTDAKGMQYFIGQMLTIDDKYGSVTLGAVLGELPRYREARPADVVVALKEVIPASKLPRVKGND